MSLLRNSSGCSSISSSKRGSKKSTLKLALVGVVAVVVVAAGSFLVNPAQSINSTKVGSLDHVQLALDTPQDDYQDLVEGQFPVSFWPMQESSGATTAEDVVGSSNGTLEGSVTSGNSG